MTTNGQSSAQPLPEINWQSDDARLDRVILDSINDGVFILDSRGEILLVNEVACTRLQYTRDELLRMNIAQIDAPEFAALVSKRMETVRKAGRAVFESAHVRRDGAIVPVEVSVRAVTYMGRPAFLGLVRDISKRKDAERRLRESEEKFAKAFRSSPTLMAISTIEDGRIVDANEAVLKALGYSRNEIIGKTTRELGTYVDYGERETMVRLLREQGRVSDLDIRLRRKNGEILHGIFCAEIIELGGERLLLSVLVDATERWRAEDALRRNQRLLDLAVTAAKGGVWDIRFDQSDPNAVPDKVYLSPALKAMAGYQPDEFPDSVSAWQSQILPEDLPAVQLSAQRHLAGITERHDVQYRLRRKDGSIRWIHSRGYIHRNKSGVPKRWTGIDWDITESKEAEEALRKARDELELKVKERTAQLRTLTAKLISAEQEERRRIAQTLHEDLQQILTGVRYALNGVPELGARKERQAAVSKIDKSLTKAIELARSLSRDLRPPVLHHGGLAEAIEWLASDTQAKLKLTVHTEIDDPNCALADDLRIFVFESVRELLLNVSKHAAVREARVRLARVGADKFQVEVCDKGTGFDAAQVRPNGIGLFSIRERAGYLGGEMQIASAPGQGTTITLTLPVR